MSYFDGRGPHSDFQQFLAGGSLRNWLRLLRDLGPPDRRYRRRALVITATTLASMPFRLYEALRFGGAIRRARLAAPPLFILGHWRSGTTHLARVLAQNPDLAPVTLVQTMIPELFLGSPLFRCILRRSLPPARPMDQVTLAPEDAEEDEYALGNLGACSFYHALSFPRRMRELFDRCVLLEGMDAGAIEHWKAVYLHFLRKVSHASGNRRLLLKNPAHTGRLRLLLQLFPDARFIHVVRDPYVVYSSTMHWLDQEMATTALQQVSATRIREEAMTNYERLMRRYLTERRLIPAGNLIELRFEDFEQAPLDTAIRVHTALGIPLSAEARRHMEHYLLTQMGYRKNRYHLNASERALIEARWGFALRAWGYEPPRDGMPQPGSHGDH